MLTATSNVFLISVSVFPSTAILSLYDHECVMCDLLEASWLAVHYRDVEKHVQDFLAMQLRLLHLWSPAISHFHLFLFMINTPLSLLPPPSSPTPTPNIIHVTRTSGGRPCFNSVIFSCKANFV